MFRATWLFTPFLLPFRKASILSRFHLTFRLREVGHAFRRVGAGITSIAVSKQLTCLTGPTQQSFFTCVIVTGVRWSDRNVLANGFSAPSFACKPPLAFI
ncbi:hypothetical protein AVEN_252859-1 [Araneus ventricosus]|uniref:Uncharacterized protein n=1 Tax=Araneus ventricosus TaxID=182803 RepID=A0A4Y2NC20_ARAVE|nr:hypothetical protein AVEN_252859-1 [Araneus ventricosus]